LFPPIKAPIQHKTEYHLLLYPKSAMAKKKDLPLEGCGMLQKEKERKQNASSLSIII